ncbi:hypothetical protein F5Y19DRAFT_71466 [Xylariaceae sp. FL1651]|nr:hypothetical protein F5Y19DRAFT_71466 [Xylariaceae sp. FL1651]
MDPIAKVWLFTLNESHSIIEAAFQSLWNETLTVAASYTAVRGEPHILFQSDDEPDLLAVVSGYHCMEASIDVQRAWADKLVPRLLEFITHKQLFVLHMDVNELPLDSGKIAILITEPESEPDPGFLPGKGSWAVQMPSLLVEAHDANKTTKRTWIQVATSEDAARLRLSGGTTKSFSMIMESRVTLQDAE